MTDELFMMLLSQCSSGRKRELLELLIESYSNTEGSSYCLLELKIINSIKKHYGYELGRAEHE